MTKELAEKLIVLSKEYGSAKVLKAWEKYSQNNHLSLMSPALLRSIEKAGGKELVKTQVQISVRDESVVGKINHLKHLKDFSLAYGKVKKEKEIVGAIVVAGEKMIDISLSTQMINLHKKLVK